MSNVSCMKGETVAKPEIDPTLLNDPVFQRVLADSPAIQDRLLAEPVYRKTGKGSLKSEGVSERIQSAIPPAGGFSCHVLADGNKFLVGELPAQLRFTPATFDELWQMQPAKSPVIQMHGRKIAIPRKQQAYGSDYRFSGQTSVAAPIPVILTPVLNWARETIYEALNGLLVNWYDGRLGHYIGRHRDSRVNMISGAPIVTISLGEERLFRLAPWRRSDPPAIDFPAKDGTVFVMPYETNLAWTHAVPALRRYTGRRISITLRAFVERTTADSKKR